MGTEAVAVAVPVYCCENKDGSLTEMDDQGYRLAQTTCLAVWGTAYEQRIWDPEAEVMTVILLQPATVIRTGRRDVRR